MTAQTKYNISLKQAKQDKFRSGIWKSRYIAHEHLVVWDVMSVFVTLNDMLLRFNWRLSACL